MARYQNQDILDITVDELPSLEPVLLSTRGMRWCKRVCSARRRRQFNLTRDWTVTVNESRIRAVEGMLVVPREHVGELQRFDGASVPCPWSVSALSIGILRPLGVMLIASVIHDFAFAHGYLLFRADGGVAKRQIGRRDADRLFRDVIATVNDLRVVAWIGYAAVRLGWLGGVKYAGKRWTRGAVPWAGLPFAAGILGVGLWGVAELGLVAWAWISVAGCDQTVVGECTKLLLDTATLYLIPSGVLVGALGVAGSEALKTGVSPRSACSWQPSGPGPHWAWPRTHGSTNRCWVLPWAFVALWVVSFAAHAVRWGCGGDTAKSLVAPGNATET